MDATCESSLFRVVDRTTSLTGPKAEEQLLAKPGATQGMELTTIRLSPLMHVEDSFPGVLCEEAAGKVSKYTLPEDEIRFASQRKVDLY